MTARQLDGRSRAATRAAAGQRCTNAERVLAHVVQRTGCYARAGQIAAAWAEVHGQPAPACVARALVGVLASAVDAGRVVVRVVRERSQFAPVASAHLPPTSAGHRPDGCGPLSGMRVIEVALERAVARYRGAVSVAEVRAEIALSPDLPDVAPAKVVQALVQLLATGRIRDVPAPATGDRAQRHQYYTTLGGPRRPARAAVRPVERRLRAVRALWRASGGRPFTTRAFTKFVAKRAPLGKPGESAQQITNGLSSLMHAGVLTRVRVPGTRVVRWALAAEWSPLSDEERAARLRDPYGRDDGVEPANPATGLTASRTAGAAAQAPVAPRCGVEPPASPGAADASGRTAAQTAARGIRPTAESGPVPHGPPHDARQGDLERGRPEALPGLPDQPTSCDGGRGGSAGLPPLDICVVSLHQNSRALVQIAQRAAANGQSDPQRRIIAAMRPVTAADVACVGRAYPHLVTRGRSVSQALSAASSKHSRLRRAIQCPVHFAGSVRDVAYYTPDPSEPASAFVTYRRAHADAREVWPARDLARLEHAIEMSAAGLMPVAGPLLRARTCAVVHDLHTCLDRLTGAHARARAAAVLFEEEHAEYVVLADRYRTAVAQAEWLHSLVHAHARPGTARCETFSAEESRGAHTVCEVSGSCTGRQLAIGQVDVAQLHFAQRALDTAAATQVIMGFPNAPTGGGVGRLLWHTVRKHVRPLRLAESAPGDPGRSDLPAGPAMPLPNSVGRRVRVYLDRIEFATYVAHRWGGPLFASIAAQGTHALGALRAEGPAAQALHAALPPTHAGATAALALLDTPGARAALRDYLDRAAAGGGGTTRAAAATAAFGLARRPCGGLAEALTDTERDALRAAERRHPEALVRSVAARVLRSWDDA